jgi:hypothetical protein
MLEELQRRNFALTTISTYLHAVEQFARHFNCRPDWLNQTHFRSYQAYLLRERKMRPLIVRLHAAALHFFFREDAEASLRLDDTPYPKSPAAADPRARAVLYPSCPQAPAAAPLMLLASQPRLC